MIEVENARRTLVFLIYNKMINWLMGTALDPEIRLGLTYHCKHVQYARMNESVFVRETEGQKSPKANSKVVCLHA